MDEKKIGQLLKKLRENKSLSQQQLADELHVSRTLVTKWESGKIALTTQNLITLSEYFNITTDEILSGAEKNSENAEMIDNIKFRLYARNNTLQKKSKRYFSISIILIFCFLIYFFITFYNSVNVYTITADDNHNISIKNGLLIKTRDKIYLRLEPKILDDKIKVQSAQLYYQLNGERTDILKLNDISTISINDFYEEQEYFEFSKFDSLKDNLYISVIYNNDSEENIKLKLKKDYVNSKLFFVKHKITNANEIVKEKSEEKNIFENVIQNNLENSFLISYNKKEYDIHVLDTQIYMIYNSNEKKEKLIYDNFDGVYFNKESSNRLVYSYSINDNVCIVGNCDDYEEDCKKFLEILELIN